MFAATELDPKAMQEKLMNQSSNSEAHCESQLYLMLFFPVSPQTDLEGFMGKGPAKSLTEELWDKLLTAQVTHDRFFSSRCSVKWLIAKQD